MPSLEKVDPDDARTRELRQAQSRAAGPAAHVEQARASTELEPVRKTCELEIGPASQPDCARSSPYVARRTSLPNAETAVRRRTHREGRAFAHALYVEYGLDGRRRAMQRQMRPRSGPCKGPDEDRSLALARPRALVETCLARWPKPSGISSELEPVARALGGRLR